MLRFRTTRRQKVLLAAGYLVSVSSALWVIPEMEDLYYDNKGLKKNEFPPAVQGTMVAVAPVTLVGVTGITVVAMIAELVDSIKERFFVR